MYLLQTRHVIHPSVTPKRDLFTRWPSPFFHLHFCSLVDNFCTSDKLGLLCALATLLSIPWFPVGKHGFLLCTLDSCSPPASHCYFCVYCPHCCSQSHSPRQSSPVFPFRMILRKMNMAYAIANICFLESSESRKLLMALQRGRGRKV